MAQKEERYREGQNGHRPSDCQTFKVPLLRMCTAVVLQAAAADLSPDDRPQEKTAVSHDRTAVIRYQHPDRDRDDEREDVEHGHAEMIAVVPVRIGDEDVSGGHDRSGDRQSDDEIEYRMHPEIESGEHDRGNDRTHRYRHPSPLHNSDDGTICSR